MGKFLENFFLKKYLNSDSEILYQGKALIYILIGMAVSMLSMAAILTYPSAIPYFIGIAAANLALLFLIKAGHLRIAGIIEVVMLSAMICFLVFFQEFEKVYEIYQFVFFQCVILFMTLLITSERIHIIIVMSIGILGTLYDYFGRALPAALTEKPPDIDDYIMAAFFLVFSGIIVIVANKRGKHLRNQVEQEAVENKQMVANLKQTITELQDDFNTGDQLIQSAGQVFNFIDEVKKRIGSVREQMNSLSTGSTHLREASTRITSFSDSVSREVSDQTAIIQESTAAVTEMASSIENISSIAKLRRDSIQSLADDLDEANQVMEELAESMNSLKKSITSLEEINEVIKGLASQTGLLAMNAAIEAAHAGNSGRGFAVVADEIRKLSENSAENAQIISQTLKEISQAINSAGAMNQKTSGAYLKIHKATEQVIRGMDEILRGISEFSSGTEEINSGTTRSISSTSRVKEGVSEVDQQIKAIADEISGQEKAASEVLSLVDMALEKLELVQKETSQVKNIGQKNADNLKTLGDKLSKIGHSV